MKGMPNSINKNTLTTSHNCTCKNDCGENCKCNGYKKDDSEDISEFLDAVLDKPDKRDVESLYPNAEISYGKGFVVNPRKKNDIHNRAELESDSETMEYYEEDVTLHEAMNVIDKQIEREKECGRDFVFDAVEEVRKARKELFEEKNTGENT